MSAAVTTVPERPGRMTAATLEGTYVLCGAILNDSSISSHRARATCEEIWRLIAAMHNPETVRYEPAMDHGTAFLLMALRHGFLTERQVAAAMSVEDSDGA